MARVDALNPGQAASIGRRGLLRLLGGAAVTWPQAARAQQSEQTRRRIAVLMGSAETPLARSNAVFLLQRLNELGWKRGRNLQVDLRWWTGGVDEMRVVIADILASSPEVVVASTNLALAMLKPMTRHVPIVFVAVGDPVGSGFVASLARPGGNITGFSSYDGPMGGKWLEVLKETAPHLTRVMAILHPETPVHQAFWRSIDVAAPRFAVEAAPGGVHDAAEIERTISAFGSKPNSGLIVLPHAVTLANRALIVDKTLRYRLPAIHADGVSLKAGGLASYSIDFKESFRQTAQYVDRILRGEKPANLPVQQPTKFTLAFNLKTARAIGIEVPPTMLARADEVIE